MTGYEIFSFVGILIIAGMIFYTINRINKTVPKT